jgi:hypothetical protein
MLVYITDHLFKYQPKVVIGIFVIFGYLNDAFSLPSIQAFTPTLDIDAGDSGLIFSIVNTNNVASTDADNSSSWFVENGSSRLIINYNTNCKNILND